MPSPPMQQLPPLRPSLAKLSPRGVALIRHCERPFALISQPLAVPSGAAHPAVAPRRLPEESAGSRQPLRGAFHAALIPPFPPRASDRGVNHRGRTPRKDRPDASATSAPGSGPGLPGFLSPSSEPPARLARFPRCPVHSASSDGAARQRPHNALLERTTAPRVEVIPLTFRSSAPRAPNPTRCSSQKAPWPPVVSALNGH